MMHTLVDNGENDHLLCGMADGIKIALGERFEIDTLVRILAGKDKLAEYGEGIRIGYWSIKGN